MENEKLKNKKSNRAWIYIAIIVVLLITNFYLFFQKKDVDEKNHQMLGQVSDVISEKEELQQEYEASLSRLDLLYSDNQQLNEELKEKNKEIEKQKIRIQNILNNKNASDAELKEARTMIRNLNRQIDSYEEEIYSLRKANLKLKEEIDSINVKSESLSAQIESGKILAIGNMKLNAISLRRKGRVEKETQKAKKADLLRISFDIIENRFIENSEETLYIAITNPEGYLLSNAALGSGSFEDGNGEVQYYSVFQNVKVEKGKPIRDVQVDWVQSSDYEKGEYIVEIFHKEESIAKKKVNLR